MIKGRVVLQCVQWRRKHATHFAETIVRLSMHKTIPETIIDCQVIVSVLDTPVLQDVEKQVDDARIPDPIGF